MTLEELEQQVACARLPVAYCWAFDMRDADTFVDLFSADAQWHRPSGETASGRDQIRTSFIKPLAGMLRHVASNVLVTPVDRNHALGMSLATVYRGVARADAPPILPAPIHVVEYRDHYRRDDDGRWRITLRHTSKVFVGS